MRQHRWLVVVAAAAAVYHWASSIGMLSSFVGMYPQEQMETSRAVIAVCLVCWAAIEIARRLVERRAPRCRCGYSLAGVKCPECGKAVGE